VNIFPSGYWSLLYAGTMDSSFACCQTRQRNKKRGTNGVETERASNLSTY